MEKISIQCPRCGEELYIFGEGEICSKFCGHEENYDDSDSDPDEEIPF